uniref:(E)-4-hydroxy-3-methylbut-2-enyl-diphosphate synthase n=1 Tax=Candidatus Kentrum sp. TC TaxID=2126339 RepID=A0A450YPL5_9GAMM|nr:MAG: (E)-4-hydroxy-3-methylbut-2-enyl-diphosphate synthase [Candidatus Kentron sp. TC]
MEKKYPGVEHLKIAVMGCVVNGPGESKQADIGIALPGKMERPIAPVYLEGEWYRDLKGKGISEQFLEILEEYVEKRFGRIRSGDEEREERKTWFFGEKGSIS